MCIAKSSKAALAACIQMIVSRNIQIAKITQNTAFEQSTECGKKVAS